MSGELLISILLFTVGLAVIIKGGDLFVDAATWFSVITGIPKFIIGATVVSIATTLPELFVSIIATLEGSIGIATGNAIGSVIANIGIGMSVGLIAIPACINRKEFAPRAVLMIAVSLVLMYTGIDGHIGKLDAFILLAMLVLYIVINIISAKTATDTQEEIKETADRKTVFNNLIKFALGAVGIIIGARLLVDHGQIIAKAVGVSEQVIGLTVIAIGTSLPELVTAITAVIKKESSLSVGNIIGANIIDMAMILPVCSLISDGGLSVAWSTVWVDIPVALLLMAIVVIPTIILCKFKKVQGWSALCAYSVYLGYVCFLV